MKRYSVDRLWYHSAAAALLTVHAVVVLWLVPQWSVTHNEAGHIAAGLAAWHSRNYYLYCVNPPLPKMLATVCLLGEPSVSVAALPNIDASIAGRLELEVGAAFADFNSLDFHEMVCRCRLLGLLWVTLGGIVVLRWTAELFGLCSSLIALALWTWEPMITANAALVTPDLPATVMGLIAAYACYRFQQSGVLCDCIIAGILLGGALLCKFTLLLLLPGCAVACINTNACASVDSRSTWIGRKLGALLLMCGVAWSVLLAGYGFDGITTNARTIVWHSEICSGISRACAELPFHSFRYLVPTAYLLGVDLQAKDFEGGMSSYCRGVWSPSGWWYYYVYAAAVKSPLGHIGMYLLALATWMRNRCALPVLIWLFPICVVVVASAHWGYTSHLRYILPAYPYAMILAGGMASVWAGRTRRCVSAIVVILLTVSGLSYYSACPHLLGYFNEPAGGPLDGWWHLSDSNVDWGQDRLYLRRWLDDHHNAPIYVDTAGYIDAGIYLGRQYARPSPDIPGYAVVSAQRLTTTYKWLLDYPLVARVGTSLFVFSVPPSRSSNQRPMSGAEPTSGLDARIRMSPLLRTQRTAE